MIKQVIYLILVAAAALGLVSLFTYDIIKIDWVSFMEIQPSFQPQEHPLPVAADSIPIEGPAYTLDLGVPVNPVASDEVSVQRGTELYRINCLPCHGAKGKGDGVIANFFTNKPSNLTSAEVQTNSDGALFLAISEGIAGRMPPLNENLYVRERWDVVNYIRTLAQVTP